LEFLTKNPVRNFSPTYVPHAPPISSSHP
jgi:hypothetical protein